MIITVLHFIAPLVCAALALWGSVFYEKDGWHEFVRFIVLLFAAVGLALSVERVMPMLKGFCSHEMLDESILKYSLALFYAVALALMSFAAFYMVTIEGLFGCPGGWRSVVGCVMAGLPLAAPALNLGVFVVKNFWWMALALLAALGVIGAIVGGNSGRVSASADGNVFVDKYGNEYIRTSDKSRIYYGDETWNVTKEYHIKGQSGTFYRKIK